MKKAIGYTLTIIIAIALMGVIIVAGRQHQAALLASQTAAHASLVTKTGSSSSSSIGSPAGTKKPSKAEKELAAKLKKVGNGKSLTYAALGDSLAAGYYTTKKDRSYQYLVRDYLQNTLGYKVKLDGDWKDGATVAGNALTDYDKIVAMKPDLVTIEYGTNEQDSTNEYYAHADTFQSNLSSLVSKLQTDLHGSGTKIVLLTSWKADTASTYTAAIKAVGKQYGVPVADITDVWKKDSGTIATKTTKSWKGTGDNYHPNDKGNQLIAKQVISSLQPLYLPKNLQNK